MTPQDCDSCGQPIWNPDFWSETGMCGPCTTGESATLFHELWIPPMIQIVDTEERFMEHWRQWYADIYKPATKNG